MPNMKKTLARKDWHEPSKISSKSEIGISKLNPFSHLEEKLVAIRTIITISTGSEQRFIDPEATFAHVGKALRNISLSGKKVIVIYSDGSVNVGEERIYTPKRPKIALSKGNRVSKS